MTLITFIVLIFFGYVTNIITGDQFIWFWIIGVLVWFLHLAHHNHKGGN